MLINPLFLEHVRHYVLVFWVSVGILLFYSGFHSAGAAEVFSTAVLSLFRLAVVVDEQEETCQTEKDSQSHLGYKVKP